MIERFEIVGFRNYSETRFPTLSEKTVIIGPNGSGKTNLLEAISIWLTGDSFRTNNLQEAISWGGQGFSLRGILDHNEYHFGYTSTTRLYRKNGKTVTAKEYRQHHPVLVFLPDDTILLYGGSEGRRRILDQILTTLDSEYRSLWLSYYRVLKQRNAQLRISPSDARIWDRQLIDFGSQIIEKRLFYLRKISARLQEYYYELYGTKLELRMLNTFRIEKEIRESFGQALFHTRELESQKKLTLVGPHRDTFEIREGEKIFRHFASQGQKRALALLLKITVATILRDQARIPLLLFDDVMLEMDHERQKMLLSRFWDSFPWMWTVYTRDMVPGPRTYEVIELPLK
ncbi:DNA replication/repair protein RecF [Thermospira aquatica]|uniref:DNA replication and repair protein RecF n=1 Tax=Thermospira aquatica TaxID=2828656 RepID=A0AAX3BBE9_9SPIR|nr:DNA replication and repair protein RecF [Thermospira aquatica]URA09565.1 DNA replication/repair protein RecF [Thermospira aquatica]